MSAWWRWTVSNPQKIKGSQYERDVVAYLQANGFPNAQRLYGAGRQDDRGDITFGGPSAGLFVLEAKNHKTHDFSGWLQEAEVERQNAGAKYAFVVAKRRGKPAGESYVLTTLDQLATLMAQLTNERNN